LAQRNSLAVIPAALAAQRAVLVVVGLLVRTVQDNSVETGTLARIMVVVEAAETAEEVQAQPPHPVA
jgi:hypothetical protein